MVDRRKAAKKKIAETKKKIRLKERAVHQESVKHHNEHMAVLKASEAHGEAMADAPDHQQVEFAKLHKLNCLSQLQEELKDLESLQKRLNYAKLKAEYRLEEQTFEQLKLFYTLHFDQIMGALLLVVWVFVGVIYGMWSEHPQNKGSYVGHHRTTQLRATTRHHTQ